VVATYLFLVKSGARPGGRTRTSSERFVFPALAVVLIAFAAPQALLDDADVVASARKRPRTRSSALRTRYCKEMLAAVMTSRHFSVSVFM
jgi:hypothetical protein